MTGFVLEEHRSYLADDARLDAYRQAIDAVVRPGDVVIDLGSGTGVLGVLACRAGAARVHAIDGSPMIEIARSVATANGVADRFRFHHQHSTRVTLPELADVVIADQLGPSGVEAGAFECFADARARLLKPGGRTMPGRVQLVLAGVTNASLRAQMDFWDTRPGDIDVGVVAALAHNTRQHTTTAPDEVVTTAGTLASVDPSDPAAASIRASVDLDVERAGELHGVAAWFDAELAPGIALTNDPRAAHRIDRLHVVYPVEEPVAVAPGGRVRVEMRIVPAEDFVRWVVTVEDPSGSTIATSRHSTAEGKLLTKGDLGR